MSPSISRDDDSASDEDLMSALVGGQTEALEHLFERHHRRLFGYLRGLVGKPEVAEELVQEVFLRVLRFRRSYRAGSRLLPWLLRIARNVAWAQLGRQARLSETELKEELAEDTTLPRSLMRELSSSQLQRALHRVNATYREALLLSYFEELSHKEVAALLGISPGAVKVRVHRAIRQLRQALGVNEQAAAKPARDTRT